MYAKDRILELLANAGRPMFTSEIAAAVISTPSNTGWLLRRMAEEGLIEKVSGGALAAQGHRWRVASPHRRQSQEARAS